jgi:hypothetical protein
MPIENPHDPQPDQFPEDEPAGDEPQPSVRPPHPRPRPDTPLGAKLPADVGLKHFGFADVIGVDSQQV